MYTPRGSPRACGRGAQTRTARTHQVCEPEVAVRLAELRTAQVVVVRQLRRAVAPARQHDLRPVVLVPITHRSVRVCARACAFVCARVCGCARASAAGGDTGTCPPSQQWAPLLLSSRKHLEVPSARAYPAWSHGTPSADKWPRYYSGRLPSGRSNAARARGAQICDIAGRGGDAELCQHHVPHKRACGHARDPCPYPRGDLCRCSARERLAVRSCAGAMAWPLTHFGSLRGGMLRMRRPSRPATAPPPRALATTAAAQSRNERWRAVPSDDADG